VHTLAKVLRCRACKDERKKNESDHCARAIAPESDPPAAIRIFGLRAYLSPHA
jgi:hypothetical protein